jgi:hypothetical protein
LANHSRVAKKAGLAEIADKHKIKLADFQAGKPISHPKGHITKQFDIADWSPRIQIQ